MTSLKTHLSVCALFALLGHAATSASPLPLPENSFPQLDGYLRNAVEQAPRMVSRNLDLEIAEAGRVQARSGLLPSVGGYFRYTRTRDDRADQADTLDVDKTYYDFSLTQPLYHWKALWNSARMGEIQKEIARGNFRQAYRLLAQEIRSGYLNLIIKKASNGRALIYLNNQREQLKAVEESFAKKTIAEAQVSIARLAVEQAELALDRAREDMRSSLESFTRLAGLKEPLTEEMLPETIPDFSYDPSAVNSLLSSFLSAPEVATVDAQNYRYQIQIEKLNYDVQKVRLLPKFSAVMGANQDEQSYTVNVAQRYQVNSLYAGVQVNWTIFDGYSASAAKRSSLARRRELELDYKNYSADVQAAAQSQARQINFSARGMSIANRNLEGGQGLLKQRMEEAQRGQASENDVRTAELALVDSRINAFNARMDYIMKLAEFQGLTAADPVLGYLPGNP